MANPKKFSSSDMRARMRYRDSYDASRRRNSISDNRPSYVLTDVTVKPKPQTVTNNVPNQQYRIVQDKSFEMVDMMPPSRKQSSFFSKFLYVFAVIVLSVSIFVTGQTFFVNKYNQEQVQALSVEPSVDDQNVPQGTGSEPSEAAVDESAFWAFKPRKSEYPRYLRIPSIEVFSRVKDSGVSKDGKVEAPWNIHDSSWYNSSVLPGSTSGTSLLVGHVSGYSTPGVFSNLKQLKTGEKIEIETGAGKVITYEISSVESIPLQQVDMAEILVSDIPGTHDIKLITCGGDYNRDTKSYEERIIVRARFVK